MEPRTVVKDRGIEERENAAELAEGRGDPGLCKEEE
jgi:hypothetical protein